MALPPLPLFQGSKRKRNNGSRKLTNLLINSDYLPYELGNELGYRDRKQYLS
jgi:hypothetical protein